MATITRPLTSRARVTMIALTLILGIAMVPVAQAKGPVDFCLKHPVKETYRLTTVGAPAVPVLSEKPGGGLVGDPYPDEPGYVFGPACEPELESAAQSPPPGTTTTTSTTTSTTTTSTTTTSTTTTTTPPPTTTTTTTTTTTLPPTPEVLARAWSIDGNGDAVLIAELTDTDFSGTPTAGDIVSTAYYPLNTAGSAFGAFGITNHTISGGFTGTDTDGASLVAAWAPCGDLDCRFEWALFDDGTRQYQRYSEFYSGSGASSTGRTGLRDTIDPTCTPESCDNASFQMDVVSINPTSPSDPAHLTYDAVLSSTDDPFLEVSIG